MRIDSRSHALKPREIIAAIVAYSFLTAVLTYPAALRITTDLIGDGGDAGQFAWNLWWFKRALASGTSPFHTTQLYHPDGISLWLHTLSPFHGLVASPLLCVLPLHVVYNLLVLGSFVAAAMGAFALSYDLTKSLPAAFVAGFVFSFSSFHFAHARGHLNLVGCEWLPFFVLFLRRTTAHGRFRDAFACALTFALNAFCDTYLMVYALLLGALLLASSSWRVLRARALVLLLSGGLAVVFVGPYVAGMAIAASTDTFVGTHALSTFSADLTSYLVPNDVSSFGRFGRAIWTRWLGNTTETACFLGYSVIALGMVAVFRVRASRPWAVMALIFGALSLGPVLHVVGADTGLRLPYALLQRMPFFALMGVPARLCVVVDLCVAVLVGYAVARLRWRRLRVAGIVVVIAIERLALPLPTISAEVPPFYRDLAREPSQWGVLDLTPSPAMAMYYATVHEKPIVGGVVARRPKSAEDALAAIPAFVTLSSIRLLPPGSPSWYFRDMCDRLRIRFVVTHDPWRRAAVEYMGSHPVHESGELSVFDCQL